MVFLLYERHQVRVPIAGHDKYVLVRVLGAVRVGKNVQQPTRLDGDDHLLE